MHRSLGQIVLDTNVALDWLFFADPAVTELAADITDRRVEWIFSEPMRREFHQVLNQSWPDRWKPRRKQALTLPFDNFGRLVDTSAPVPDSRLMCSDPTDQMFVDLALAQGARWLVSRDKALLKLARTANRLGLLILRPTDWCLIGSGLAWRYPSACSNG